jgi:flagellin
MLAIKNNIMAGNAARNLGSAYDGLAKSVERLSTGLRINSAKDDAAGLAVRELMRADIAVTQQGSRNAQDGISMLQTMEGATGVVADNLTLMKQLAEQASTGSYSSAQRVIMNSQFVEMAAEIDRIAGATSFNGITMLNNTNAVEINVGSSATISIAGQNMTTGGLNITTGNAGEMATSTLGVNLLTDTFLTVNDTSNTGATDALQLAITFSDGATPEQTVTVNFADAAAAGATSYTLQQVIDAINTASENINLNDSSGNSLNYAMASAVYNTSDGNYHLQLNSKNSTGSSVAITAATASTDVNVGSVMLGTVTTFDVTPVSVAANFTAATGTGLNILTVGAANTALTRLTTAINTQDAARSAFGYKMNRLESTISVLNIQAENLSAAESRVSDVDIATEMTNMTKTQVLAQAGVAMLTQANNMPQMALTLLRG